MLQRFLVPLYTFIYWKRLRIKSSYKVNHIVKVKGWRTMLIDGISRETITPLFKFFKWYL